MDAPRSPLTDPASPRPRYVRVAMHLAGLAAAGVIAWLIWHGYRQPELMLDLAAMRLC